MTPKPVPPKGPLCIVCGKPAAVSDRNSDGTYAHAACLYGSGWGGTRK